MGTPFSVYKHTCLVNGKVYIGQTRLKPKKRWNSGKGYKDQKIFYSDIQKYGWDNFQHEILEENISEEMVNEREKYWIAFFNATDPTKGYNQLSGGSSCYSHTEEQKKQISNSLKIYYQTEQGKLFMKEKSKSMLGSKNPNYNAEKARINEIKRHHRMFNPNAKPIICIETGKIFEVARQASELYNIDPSSITKCCKSIRKSAGGYHWRYATKEEVDQLRKEIMYGNSI